MSSERHQLIGDIYHRALALLPEQRAGFLDDACRGDSALLEEVESLLAAHEQAGPFMDASALEVAARLLHEDGPRAPERIGRYQLLGALGRGGMGEVHLAEDPALGRKVAIKLLSPPLTTDAHAVARFEDEARAASSLNHPNIVTIHEIGAVGDRRFIVMELVEGQPLSAFVGETVPVEKLLPIGRQLAEALAVAHAAGIVHRDIKPENVMVRPDGYVKLLDFGVALLVSARAGTNRERPAFATHPQMVIGTPRYMSPEQIRGEAATTASDVFGLGTVLYELVSGRHPDRDSAADVPSSLEDLLRRMLDQNPARRPAAAQAAAELAAIERRSTGGLLRRRIAVAAAAAVVAVAIALLLLDRSQPGSKRMTSEGPIRFLINPPPKAAFSPSSASLALSPDGRSLAFTASEAQSGLALWIQPLGSLEARKVPGSDAAGQIFWSPDSRSVAFADTSSEFSLKRIDVASGLVQSVPGVRLAGAGVGSWGPQGQLLVKTADQTLQQVSLSGSALRPLTTPDSRRGETEHGFPVLLPDGRHFLFLATGNQPEYDGIGYIGSVDAAEHRRLFKSDSQIVYAAGHLLYMLDNTLLARPFDAASLRLTGEPAVIAEHVERTAGSRRGAFTLSETGVLAYRLQNETQLVWYDRDGRRGEVLGRRGHYRNPALSPDDKMLAVGLLDANTGDSDLWTIDVARNAAVRLTAPSSSDDMPAWSPDGTQIAFKSYGTSRGTDRRNAFYRRLASGTGEPELLLSNLRPSAALHAWTAEDLVYSEITSTRDYDLFRLPLVGARKPARILGTPLSDAFCQLSPDGRLMAYASNQSGAFEIYVSAFPSDRDRIQISTKGGTEPAWRRDGKELFYLSPERKVMAAAINSGSRLSAGPSQPLFEAAVSSLINPSYTRNQYVVSGDGQRFLVNEPLGRASLSSVVVVINWPAVFDQSSARAE